MTDPHRVRAFLDFAGHWNPSLAGVMAGAIAVHGTALLIERRRLGTSLGPQAALDAKLIGGAALFGVGWGLAGYCPGPAIVALGLAPSRSWPFFGAMVLGVLLGESGKAATASGPRPLLARRAAPVDSLVRRMMRKG